MKKTACLFLSLVLLFCNISTNGINIIAAEEETQDDFNVLSLYDKGVAPDAALGASVNYAYTSGNSKICSVVINVYANDYTYAINGNWKVQNTSGTTTYCSGGGYYSYSSSITQNVEVESACSIPNTVTQVKVKFTSPIVYFLTSGGLSLSNFSGNVTIN